MTLIKRWLWSKVTLIKRWLSSKVVFDQIYHFDEYIFFVFCFKLSKNFSASALRASAPCVRVVSNKSVLSGIFPKIHVRVNTIIRYIRVRSLESNPESGSLRINERGIGGNVASLSDFIPKYFINTWTIYYAWSTIFPCFC